MPEREPGPGCPFVTPDWLAERLDRSDLAVVDGSWYLPAMQRDPAAEFLAGHVPGAVRVDIETVRDTDSALPHMLPAPDAFAAAMGELGIAEDMTVVVYDGAGLFSAPRVWWMFSVFGARDVRILAGGFPAWTAAGHPVEQGAQRPRARAHASPPGWTRARWPTSDGSGTRAGRRHGPGRRRPVGRAVPRRGAGAAARGCAAVTSRAAATCPTARWCRDGRLADPETITAAVRTAGIDSDRPVITSCGSGVTAAILWLALDAIGHPPVALYDGSYTEWAGRADVPVATGDA